MVNINWDNLYVRYKNKNSKGIPLINHLIHIILYKL